MKRSKNVIEKVVVEDEEFYHAPQVNKVEGKQLSLESQVVISILAGVNFALFYFLFFMIQ